MKEEEKSIQVFIKKEDFLFNKSGSEYWNKPNRDENAAAENFDDRAMLDDRAIIYKGEARVRFEILTPEDIKAKALKLLYFHQEITKTEAQEITPKIIIKKRIKRKDVFF